MSTVEDRLAEIVALADAATEGPWEAVGPYIEAAGEEFAEVSMDVDGSDDERAPIDAAFIAAARTLVPELVAALRAALALLDSAAGGYAATSERMSQTVIKREPHDFDRDDIIRYGAYASGAKSLAGQARDAITAALGVTS